MPLVTLTDDQIMLAEQIANKRVLAGKNKVSRVFVGQPLTDELRHKIDYLGVVSELAVSLFLGLPWESKDGIGDSDVGGFEVRSTQREDGKNYFLYVREYDKDAIYIYCIVDVPYVVIAGWAGAWQVRNLGALMFTDTNAYGLPRAKLNPMSQLAEVAEFASRKC